MENKLYNKSGEEHERTHVLSGSHRAGVVGSNKGTGFYVDFGSTKALKIPARLQQYDNSRQITAQEIANKQKLAENRKKKHDEAKAQQAKKVREEAIKFDKKMQALMSQRSNPQQRRWFEQALPK